MEASDTHIPAILKLTLIKTFVPLDCTSTIPTFFAAPKSQSQHFILTNGSACY
jgi:hypothetical protein